MVVAAILGLALALPTGALFGVGYGTGVRIGYEQVYPLLFPPKTGRPDATLTNNNIKSINQIYDAIGGKEASQMGIANGILSKAVGELQSNPDFQVLGELESSASGVTSLNLTLAKILEVQTLSLEESVNYRLSRGSLSQREGNEEDRPPTVLDIPIISDSSITEDITVQELSDPYTFKSQTLSQLLNQQTAARLWSQAKRNNLYDWIKIKRETKLEQVTVTTPEKFTPDKPFNAQTEAVKQYQITRGQHIETIGLATNALNKYKASVSNALSGKGFKKGSFESQQKAKASFTAKTKTLENQQSNARKKLQNFITRSRNITATKLQANQDWNARIWLRY